MLRVDPGSTVGVSLTVNDVVHTVETYPRESLAEVLRDRLGLTGTHLGCEQGVCGCCTVLLDDEPVRACLVLAVQTQGRSVRTVESLADPDGTLHPLQEAFSRRHALQCGFCTPGQLMNAVAMLESGTAGDETQIRAGLAGQLCRCTGYAAIVDAIRDVAEQP